MNNLASPETLSTLRDGSVLTANADLDLQLSARAPVAFDLHWLRSLAGLVLGSTGIRVDAEAAAAISLAGSCQCLATVRREDRDGQPWLHLTLDRDSTLSASPSLSVQATVPVPDELDPLRLALTGDHPRQVFRQILKTLGSAAFDAFVQNSGIRSRQIAALAALWPSLTASTEPVLWKAALEPAQLSAIRDLTCWLATECLSAGALRDRLLPPASGVQASPASLLVQWMEALTGGPVSALLTGSAFDRAKQVARTCLPLLQLPELPTILQQILQTPPARQPDAFPAARDLAGRLYDSAGPALAHTLSADLSLRLAAGSGHAVLLDASFHMDAEGLALYRSALAGNLTPLLAAPSPSIEIHSAVLTDSVLRRRTLEIHLPFLFSATREKELASMTQTEIVSGVDGSLTVIRSTARSTNTRKTDRSTAHNEQQSRMIIAATLSAADREPANDNFSLSFSDVRDIVPGRDYRSYLQALSAYGIQDVSLPAGPARATLAITLPGSVVQAWTRVPLTRKDALAPLLCRVSVALQTTLRRWLPMLYLADPERYATPSAVFPLLAYQYSQPYARVRSGEYTYDSMDPAALASALNCAAPRLKTPLAGIQASLLAAGQRALAGYYDPDRLPQILQSVLLQKSQFASLLAADTFFIEQVLSLARYSRDLSTTAAKDPRRAARDLNNFTSDFVKVFHRRLGRLYGGEDFTALGSLLLIEATAALAGQRDALQARFTVEPAA